MGHTWQLGMLYGSPVDLSTEGAKTPPCWSAYSQSVLAAMLFTHLDSFMVAPPKSAIMRSHPLFRGAARSGCEFAAYAS